MGRCLDKFDIDANHVFRGHGFGAKPQAITMAGRVDTYRGSYRRRRSLAILNLGDGRHRQVAGRAGEIRTPYLFPKIPTGQPCRFSFSISHQKRRCREACARASHGHHGHALRFKR